MSRQYRRLRRGRVKRFISQEIDVERLQEFVLANVDFPVFGGAEQENLDDRQGAILVVERIVEAVRNIVAASRSAIHAATLGVGAGRMRSDATLVSITSMPVVQENSGGSRIGPRRAGSSSSTPPSGAKHSLVNAARFLG